MTRFQPYTIKERGQVAQAMAAVQKHRNPAGDVTGTETCTKCGGRLRFTIQPNGISRGRCSCGVTWCQ